MSCTEKTKNAYRRRGRWLAKRAKAELCVDQLNFDQFAAWFLFHHDSWRPSTIRQYRAAIVALVHDQIASRQLDKHQGEQIIAKLRGRIGDDGRQAAPRPTKTSSRPRKRKCAPPRLVERLRQRLCHFHTKAAVIAHKIAANGPEIGVRGCEWDSIEVYDGFCRVRNAKSTNGRANGTLRVIVVPPRDLTRELLATANEIATAIQAGIPWENMQRRVNYYLRRASRDIGLKQPISLSTLRHIAIGRWKVAFSPAEVAALAGHASNATAVCHYGRSRSGRKWPPVSVKPYSHSLERVRDHFRSYDQRKITAPVISPMI